MINRKTPQFSAGDTLLFEVKKQQHNQSQLKEFIHFIKYCGRRGPIRFRHIEEGAELMVNLTLRENLLLDLGVRDRNENSISDILKSEERIALSKLMDCVKDENMYPSQATKEDKKIISIIKILLHNSDYLFLEKPEKYLSQTNQKVFFDALFASKEKFDQTLLITSDHRNLWLDHVNKIVSKGTNGHFALSDIVRHTESAEVVELRPEISKYNSKKAA